MSIHKAALTAGPHARITHPTPEQVRAAIGPGLRSTPGPSFEDLARSWLVLDALVDEQARVIELAREALESNVGRSEAIRAIDVLKEPKS